MIKLSDLRENQAGIIKEILETKISEKLLEFGVHPGSSFKVLSIAPFRGPIFIQIGDLRVALRRMEANHIIVE